MKNKINKINKSQLIKELKGNIKEFYPYFLGFYILSLSISLFSKTWQSFFYWPAFHISIVAFTIMFVFSLDLEFGKMLPKKFIFPHLKGYKRAHIFFQVFFSFIIKILSFVIHVLSSLSEESSKDLLVLKTFFKGNILWIYGKVRSVSKKDWIKLLIVILVAIVSYVNINVIESLVLVYALTSFLFIINSRVAIIVALIILISCPFLLILKEDILAEQAAINVFYFLIITVVTQIRELHKN